jgi:hypothetical protein
MTANRLSEFISNRFNNNPPMTKPIFGTYSASLDFGPKPYRSCPPWDQCGKYPCRHTPCQDSDWLADIDDSREDQTALQNLWMCFWFPHLKTQVRPEEWAKYEAKFDRCRRIEAKKDAISAEIRAHSERMHQEWNLEETPEDKSFESKPGDDNDGKGNDCDRNHDTTSLV